jgi:ABC-type multidrug transport system fused ATPase/permease subunit
MSRRTRTYTFVCLTLFKEDVSELLQIFQTHLEDVEFTIDSLPIRDLAQLNQFNATYQAASVFSRGYHYKIAKADIGDQNQRQLVELRMNKAGAVLQLRNWDDKAEPEVSIQVRNVLIRCQNRVHSFLQLITVFLFVGFPISLLTLLIEQHHIDFSLRLILLIGPGFLLMTIAYLLFYLLLSLLHLNTQIFLFPGAARIARVYGRGEAVGRLVIATVLIVALQTGLFVAFRLLWR